MKSRIGTFVLLVLTVMYSQAMEYRGVVYDVGLQYNPGQYSVSHFNPAQVEYDMQVISTTLHTNAVRIEGQEISRLIVASEMAHKAGMKVFFNPWWMNADAETVIAYMAEAAKAAEWLRKKNVDITFVAGCEFTLFNKGIFEGNSVTERLASMMQLAQYADDKEKLDKKNAETSRQLNSILRRMVDGIRSNFKGQVTYSAGTWEPVDWSMFDVIGLDYYRDKHTDEEYLDGLRKYYAYKKPVWVMEVGCCTYEGAAQLGGSGFTVCHGVDEEGNGIYAGGVAPKRSEKEQADYAERQIRLLHSSGIEGMFIFEFSFPIAPYREKGHDADLTAYPIVKSFAPEDPRSQQLPAWQPKEAFHRVGNVYRELERKNSASEKLK